TGWNISRASKILGISRLTLRARIRRWNLAGGPGGTQAVDAPSLGARSQARAPSYRTGETKTESTDRSGRGTEPRLGADAAQPATPAEAHALRWERRWLGFLRFSLTGSGEDETMVSAPPYLEVALEKVHQFAGHVIEIWSTGLTAAFGLDVIEESVQRAGFAALAIQIAANRMHQDIAGASEWRIVLHAMSCLVGSHGQVPHIDRDARRRVDAFMDALVLAGKRGDVLASGDIAPFLRRRFNLGHAVASSLAGPARPVLGPSLQSGQFGERPGTFIGRRQEMQALEARALLAHQGSGQIVGIVGDPGVGKSRLVWEFAHGSPDRGWLLLDTASEPRGRPTPFLAVIDLLRVYFDVAPGETVESVRDKVTRRLASLDETLMPALPAFLALLDVPVEDTAWQLMEPLQRQRLIVTGIRRLMLRESARQPLLLVFEDAHWADAATRELLEEIA